MALRLKTSCRRASESVNAKQKAADRRTPQSSDCHAACATVGHAPDEIARYAIHAVRSFHIPVERLQLTLPEAVAFVREQVRIENWPQQAP
jgi:hypothetical protein